MNLKDGVTQQGVHPSIWYAIGLAEAVYKTNGLRLVITSLTDGEHMKDSLHYSGRAVDLRTRNVPTDMLKSLYGSLVNILNPMGYDVILEADHLHIEFDPKPGENWQRYEA